MKGSSMLGLLTLLAASLGIGAVVLVEATDGDDTIDGTDGRDEIDGLGGDDILRGLGGNDVLNGGPGRDHLSGNVGADVLIGGAQDDRLYGNVGDDLLFGGSGDDLLRGSAGDDLLYTGSGFDRVEAGTGDDTIYGRDSGVIQGGSGDDRIFLTGGRQLVDVDARAEGTDNFATRVQGGPGSDLIVGSDLDENLYASLRQSAGTGLDHRDSILDNNEIRAGGGDDRLYGGRGNDLLFGGSGDDLLVSGDGVDILDGGDGNDEIRVSGQGGKTVLGGKGNDLIFGRVIGDDRLSVQDEAVVMDAGEGNDIVDIQAILSGDGVFELNGRGGDDFLRAESFAPQASPILNGGDGDDFLDLEAENYRGNGAIGTGGAGGDTFLVDFDDVLGGIGPTPLITDFQPGQDTLIVSTFIPEGEVPPLTQAVIDRIEAGPLETVFSEDTGRTQLFASVPFEGENLVVHLAEFQGLKPSDISGDDIVFYFDGAEAQMDAAKLEAWETKTGWRMEDTAQSKQ